MDRLAEKKQRLLDLSNYAKKLISSDNEYSKYPARLEYQLVGYSRRAWLLSSSVARDYARLAIEMVKGVE